jgi:hypothetical protein
MIESQCTYISNALKYCNTYDKHVFELKKDICDKWNAKMQRRLKKSVWQTGGCKSWYLDKKGNNTTLYPGFTWEYRLTTERFDDESYVFQ